MRAPCVDRYGTQTDLRLDTATELTFIVLNRPADAHLGEGTKIEQLIDRCEMAGDVNLFISDLDDVDDEGAASQSADRAPQKNGELQVMIAGECF